ncbi:molybdopterin-binding protein [Campylobacter concisus]|uniref:TOBE domain-containing protein n=1 Tax=Campylobacter concisus TaxID=199 RepID=UPI00122C8075|nr:TOBE domain-containing protein [Campylobacter concisus]
MIKAKIVQISSKDGVSFFELECLNLGINLYMLALNEASKFALDDEVSLNFKSSDVILSRLRLEASSLENELKCEVTDITRGEILSIISLKCEQLCFEAIISDHALKRLNLAVGEQVFAYIKSTSIHVSA